MNKDPASRFFKAGNHGIMGLYSEPQERTAPFMLKGMDYVYAVYKERSFSKAAEKLYISQPALSSTIKKVEKELGLQLFDRSTSPVRVTPAGEY